jgi:hypothetical protein
MYEWKQVVKRNIEGRVKGIFALEDIKKDDFIIEYLGNIVYSVLANMYGMKINDMDLWIDPLTNRSPAKIHESLLQPKLHSCTMGHQRNAMNVLLCN